jgi:hypothetical protein
MDLQDIKQKAETYFEWPNKDRDYITYYSAMVFALDCVKDVTKKPIPLKDKITAGLQCQVAKIRELEAENKRLKGLEGALKVIHTWASFDCSRTRGPAALVAEDVVNLCKKYNLLPKQ